MGSFFSSDDDVDDYTFYTDPISGKPTWDPNYDILTGTWCRNTFPRFCEVELPQTSPVGGVYLVLQGASQSLRFLGSQAGLSEQDIFFSDVYPPRTEASESSGHVSVFCDLRGTSRRDASGKLVTLAGLEVHLGHFPIRQKGWPTPLKRTARVVREAWPVYSQYRRGLTEFEVGTCGDALEFLVDLGSVGQIRFHLQIRFSSL